MPIVRTCVDCVESCACERIVDVDVLAENERQAIWQFWMCVLVIITCVVVLEMFWPLKDEIVYHKNMATLVTSLSIITRFTAIGEIREWNKLVNDIAFPTPEFYFTTICNIPTSDFLRRHP